MLEALQARPRLHVALARRPRRRGRDADRSLAESVGAVDDRERVVLHLRFVRERTQSEIAREVGCSQMQVSRILPRAVARLSERARAD